MRSSIVSFSCSCLATGVLPLQCICLAAYKLIWWPHFHVSSVLQPLPTDSFIRDKEGTAPVFWACLVHMLGARTCYRKFLSAGKESFHPDGKLPVGCFLSWGFWWRLAAAQPLCSHHQRNISPVTKRWQRPLPGHPPNGLCWHFRDFLQKIHLWVNTTPF